MDLGLNFTVAFDALIAVLLLATIAYAVVLNRKLTALRNAKADMERLLRSLSDSTGKAESGIVALRTHASETGEILQRRIGEARALADDLTFLVEKGAPLADRLADRLGDRLGPRGTGRQDQAPVGTTAQRAKGPAPKTAAKSAVRPAARPDAKPAAGLDRAPGQEIPFPMTAVAAVKATTRASCSMCSGRCAKCPGGK
jgi:hypothetical protein